MEETSIQKFYKNANVFITGGTGFLGKNLIEKLLRSTEVNTIYLLIREKKEKNMHVRIDELFNDVIFSRLKKECPKFKHRVQGISGDCQLSGLGLNIIDKQTLISKVNVVFHVAAIVNFDVNLKLAYNINVNGTKCVVDLSRQMTNLKSIVYVSTAYSNCPITEIDEKIYDCPMSYKAVQAMIEKVSDEEADLIKPRIVGKWPNTYTFTKALAENLIDDIGRGLPIAVFRPSIVISTYKEPFEGWIDNLNGLTGIYVGAMTGVLRTLHCNPNSVADIIPVDTCVAALIATSWEVSSNKCDSKSEIAVYNYVSQPENPISWREIHNLTLYQKDKYPVRTSLWHMFVILSNNIYIYWLLSICLHTIPALIMDFFFILSGQKPKMFTIHKKVKKLNSVFSYFTTRSWKYSNENIIKLWKNLDKHDKELFPFSVTTVHWLTFFRHYLLGIRRYFLHDPDTTLPEAKKRQKRFFLIHNALKYLLIFVILNTVFGVFSMLFSVFN